VEDSVSELRDIHILDDTVRIRQVSHNGRDPIPSETPDITSTSVNFDGNASAASASLNLYWNRYTEPVVSLDFQRTDVWTVEGTDIVYNLDLILVIQTSIHSYIVSHRLRQPDSTIQ